MSHPIPTFNPPPAVKSAPTEFSGPRPDDLPPSLAPELSAIPAELRALPGWVCWRYEPRGVGYKPSKVPVDPKTGRTAKTSERATWGTFEQAAAFYQRHSRHAGAGRVEGVGIVVTRESGLVGIDLDHCLDSGGHLCAAAAMTLQSIGSYAEVSPSGHGLRVFVFGELPPGRRRQGGVEAYDGGHYLTVTGRVWGDPLPVMARPAELATWYSRTLGSADAATPTDGRTQSERVQEDDRPSVRPAAPGYECPFDDGEALTNLMVASPRGWALFCGDLAAGGIDDNDQSKADFALAAELGYWCGPDAAAIERLMRASDLARDKWDEVRPAPNDPARTYLRQTIHKVLVGKRRFHPGVAAEVAERRVEKLFGNEGFNLPAWPSEVLVRNHPESELAPIPAAAPGMLREWSVLRKVLDRPTDWLVPGWLERGTLGVLVGAPFAGKSLILADLVAALCHGAEWAGIGVAKVPVVVFDRENGDRVLARRLDKALAAISPTPPGSLFDVPLEALLGPISADVLATLLSDFYQRLGLDPRRVPPDAPRGLIVVDTLRAAFAGDRFDENNNSAVAAALAPIRRLAHKSGWSVLLVHHTAKSGAYSGATAIMSCADVAWAWESRKEKLTGVLKMLGSTDAHQPARAFVFDPREQRNLFHGMAAQAAGPAAADDQVKAGIEAADDAAVLAIIPSAASPMAPISAPPANAITQADVARRAGLSPTRTLRALTRLEERGEVRRQQVRARGNPTLCWRVGAEALGE